MVVRVVWAKMMGLENDIEDLNLDFSDRCIDKPKVLKNLAYEFRFNGESSGASSLESLDFGYDDGFIYDHQLDFPAIHIEKDEHDGFIVDDQLEFPAEFPVINKQNDEQEIPKIDLKELPVMTECVKEITTENNVTEVSQKDTHLNEVSNLCT